MSRRRHEATAKSRREVQTLAGLGIQQSAIATLIECDEKTLRKYYRRELDVGVTEANARVAASLYNLAVKEGNVTACIWWTKARMGWKEGTDLNVGGNGQPVRYEFIWGSALPDPNAATVANSPRTIEAETEPEDADAAVPVVRWRGE
jgi:hypothetical protein